MSTDRHWLISIVGGTLPIMHFMGSKISDIAYAPLVHLLKSYFILPVLHLDRALDRAKELFLLLTSIMIVLSLYLFDTSFRSRSNSYLVLWHRNQKYAELHSR